MSFVYKPIHDRWFVNYFIGAVSTVNWKLSSHFRGVRVIPQFAITGSGFGLGVETGIDDFTGASFLYDYLDSRLE